MAFPDANMAVHQACSPTTFNTVLFNFKNDMVAAGYRVLGSSDGTIYENTGQTSGVFGTGSGGVYDVWDSAADIVRNVGGGKASWLRLKTPANAVNQIEFLLSLDRADGTTPDGETHIFRLSRSIDTDGFDTSGAGGTAPTASDQLAPGQINPGEQGTAGNDEGRFMAPDAAAEAYWAIGDAAEDFDFLFWTQRDSTSVHSAFGKMTVTNPNTSWTGDDPDPTIYICAFRDADTVTDSVFDPLSVFQTPAANTDGDTQESYTGSTPAFNDDGGCYASIYLDGTLFPGTYAVAAATPHIEGDDPQIRRDPESGYMMMQPIHWMVTINNFEFIKGAATGALIKHSMSLETEAFIYGTTLTQSPTNSDRRLVVERLSVPWRTDTDYTYF